MVLNSNRAAFWLVFTIFLYIPQAWSSNSYGSAFTHQSTQSNTSGNATQLDNPLTNNQPEVALFVTNASSHHSGRIGQPAQPVTIEAFYSNSKWHIRNTTGSIISSNTRFNVLVLPRDFPGIYIHQNKNRSNIQIYTGSYDTRLRHSLLDGNRNAKFIVSQVEAKTNGRVNTNNSPVGAYYKNGYWYLYNKDRSAFPRNSTYNVFISPHIITASAKARSYRLSIDSELTKKQPDKKIFITQRALSLNGDNILSNHVFYGLQDWQIANQPSYPMPINQEYNVFVYDEITTQPRTRAYTISPDGVSREFIDGSSLFFDPIANDVGRYINIRSIGYDTNHKLLIKESATPERSVDSGYLHYHQGTKSVSKYVQNRFGQNIGLFTAADNKKIVVRIDYDLDGLVDHMAFHDGELGSSTFYVRETEEALRNFEELLAGRNTFCQMEQVKNANDQALPGYGVGANQNAIFLGCGPGGVPSGRGAPTFSPNNNTASNSSEMMESMCSAVLQRGSFSPGLQMAGGWEEAVGGLILGAGLGAGGSTLAAAGVIATPVGVAVLIVGGGAMIAYGAYDSYQNEQAAARADAAATRQLARANEHESRARQLEADGADQDEVNEEKDAAATARLRAQKYRDVAAHRRNSSPAPSPDTGPSGDTRMREFCEGYMANRNSHSLDSLEKGVAQLDCPSEVENVSGIAMSTGGGGGGAPGPSGPYQPNLGRQIENELFCANQVTYPSLGAFIQERCSNPVAQPGGDNDRCPSSVVDTDTGSIDVGIANIIAPKFAADVKKLKDMVVNPGIRNGLRLDLNRNLRLDRPLR